MNKYWRVALILPIALSVCSFMSAQDAPAPQPEQPAAVPVITTPDPMIFRRTPVIDAKVEAGEWDMFYSADVGADKVVTYADWDSRNLYLAVHGTKPVKLTAVIDASGDGWFHGGDNYRIDMNPKEAGVLSVDVVRYDSKSKNPEPSPVDSQPQFLARSSDDMQTIEIAIPHGSLVGLNLKNAKKLGIRLVAQVGDSGPIPQAALGDTIPCTLVCAKSASLDPVEIEMDMRDARVTPGEELVSKLTVRNKSKQPVAAEKFVIGGEGKASRYLNSEMIRIEGLGAGAKMRRTFRSRIPKDMPIGSWGIGAEVRSADGRLGGTLISFEVVPPHELTLETGEEKFVAGTDEWHTVKVIVRNNTQTELIGTVKLLLPQGWQAFKNDTDKLFHIPYEDGVYPVSFRVRLTDKAETGAVQIKAEVTIGKQKLSVAQTVEVIESPGKA